MRKPLWDRSTKPTQGMLRSYSRSLHPRSPTGEGRKPRECSETSLRTANSLPGKFKEKPKEAAGGGTSLVAGRKDHRVFQLLEACQALGVADATEVGCAAVQAAGALTRTLTEATQTLVPQQGRDPSLAECAPILGPPAGSYFPKHCSVPSRASPLGG